MRIARKHKRFKLNVIDLNSSMSRIGKVEIKDISAGGAAIKAAQKLNIGKECLMTLSYEEQRMHIKGIVVRSELSGIEEGAEGETVAIYSAGILFKDESTGKVKDYLDSIEHTKKELVPIQADWFYRDVYFWITTPSEEVLHLPSQFEIIEINQGGAIIQTDHHMNIDSMVLMELSFGSFDPVSFMGKVVSCRRTRDAMIAKYAIGVEFAELTDRDRSLLNNFIAVFKEIS